MTTAHPDGHLCRRWKCPCGAVCRVPVPRAGAGAECRPTAEPCTGHVHQHWHMAPGTRHGREVAQRQHKRLPGLRSAMALLVLIGVAAAAGRAAFPSDFGGRMEPVRQDLLQAIGRRDPDVLQRARDVQLFDSRLAAYPAVILVHVVVGGVFLTLLPIQVSSRVRSRWPAFHRWTGRVLIPAAFVTTASGLWFGLRTPFGGAGEAVAIAVFGGFLLLSVSCAFVAIRRHDVARHREWMLRALAIALGISTIRVVGALLDVVLSPAGVRPQDQFVLSIWIGWGLTLAAAEGWIRYTRGVDYAEGSIRGLRRLRGFF